MTNEEQFSKKEVMRRIQNYQDDSGEVDKSLLICDLIALVKLEFPEHEYDGDYLGDEELTADINVLLDSFEDEGEEKSGLVKLLRHIANQWEGVRVDVQEIH